MFENRTEAIVTFLLVEEIDETFHLGLDMQY